MPSGQGKNLIDNKSLELKQIPRNHIRHAHYAAQKNKMSFYVAEGQRLIRLLSISNWTRTFKFNDSFVNQATRICYRYDFEGEKLYTCLCYCARVSLVVSYCVNLIHL